MAMMNTNLDTIECVITMCEFDKIYAFYDKQNRCFDARALQKWLNIRENNLNPFTRTEFSKNELKMIEKTTSGEFKYNTIDYENLYCNKLISLPESMYNQHE